MANSSRFNQPSRGQQVERRLGSETPRIFTPPLRKLTPKTSAGFSAIEFAEHQMLMELFPWQKWLLIHALELLPDNSFRFRRVVVLVARQNGKSTVSQVLALWFLYVYGYELVLGTAQDLDTAEELWQGTVDLVEELDEDDNPIRPELLEMLERVVLTNGKKTLELTNGSRYKVKAANRRAGRGLTGDLVLLDELREHQTWDAWAALTKTTNARANAQIWALSNAGDASSLPLRYLRKKAHAGLGDPDGVNAMDDPESLLASAPVDADLSLDDDTDSLAIFEWSAPPGNAIGDRAGWAQANPSLGYTISEKTIAGDASTDPEWVFRTEVLCQWSDGSLEGPFPPGAWDGCLDPESELAPDTPLSACVDVSWNRSMAHIAICGKRADGTPHVEVVASRAGTDWVIDWLAERAEAQNITHITAQANGAPASSLADDLAKAKRRPKGLPEVEDDPLVAGLKQLKIKFVPWSGTEIGRGCGAFYDAVKAAKLRHLVQPILDVPAATAAVRPLGDAWVWDRKKSTVDISPLVAVTAAHWLEARRRTVSRSRVLVLD